MTSVTASFGKPFAFQVAAYRLRLAQLQPTFQWTDVWKAEHDRAFMVAGAVKADILADLATMVDKAVSQGTTLEEFRRDFKAMVAQKGWQISKAGQGTKKGEAWRTKVIYKTNMATSYAAGRWAQLREAGYPFIVYKHGGSLHPREQHLGWDGLVLEADHPFWTTHAPPNGWGCSCFVSGARSRAAAKRVGGKPDKTLPDGWQKPDPKTGAPVGIDKGWDYAPGASVADAIIALTQKLPSYPAPIGAALFASLPASASEELDRAFGEFVDRSLSSYMQKDFMVIGALRAEWIAAAEVLGIKVASAEVAVVDQRILHTFRGTEVVTSVSTRSGSSPKPKVDPLDLDWFKSLPSRLQSPDSVFLDATQPDPAYILVFDLPARHAKIVIRINAYVGKAGVQMNSLNSGRIIDANDIDADIGRGVVQIWGRNMAGS